MVNVSKPPLLSICIPTYNRADCLQGGLEKVIPQAKKYGIPIYISDNASTDNTEIIVKSCQKKYPNIIYLKRSKNYGATINIAKVLRMSKTKYSWLLGDDDRLTKNAIVEMLKILELNNYDMVVVNGGKKVRASAEKVRGRVSDLYESSAYSDRNKLLADLGWHMTWMSCLIFSSKMIREGRFEAFFDIHVPHFAVIFDYLSQGNKAVYWEAKPFIYGSSRDLSNWRDKAFEVFGRMWIDAVKELPADYTLEAKNACIKNHGIKGRLFSPITLIILRLLGYYDLSVYRESESHFARLTNLPKSIMWMIAIIPVPKVISHILRKLVVFMRRGRN
ncbi:MAG: glycosyltransferase family 2 protein [Candidatus Margulisiibacteriota bacterium]|nr:glycosyltransferase family 2 protein [Candidatus Margulisiibacteriota bacterium]